MTGVELIAAERNRQIKHEGWTSVHDDEEHACEELALAAATYATPEKYRAMTQDSYGTPKPSLWPSFWWPTWYKPSPNDRIRELVKAGALIAAEIDRLQRAAALASPAEGGRG